MTTPEGKIKVYLKQRCNGLCWQCFALVNPIVLGWPDRTLMANSPSGAGLIAFVETKAPTTGHKAEHQERQRRCQGMLRGLGFPVFVVSTEGNVEQMFHALVFQYGWP